jgi:hypothetical protein
MSKVSSFYSKDEISWESKLCNFVIQVVDEGTGEARNVAEVEVDMADYVNHNNTQQRIDIKCDQYSGMFLIVNWSILESSERGSTLEHRNSIFGLNLEEANPDQIKTIVSKAKELEINNEDLEAQISMVLTAKQNLEKILIAERRETVNLKKQLEENNINTAEAPINQDVSI